jgi:Ca2+-binding EF-hand superfamily protein
LLFKFNLYHYNLDCDGSIDVVEYETFVKYLVATVTRRRCEAVAETVKWTSSDTNLAVSRRKDLEQKIASIPEEFVRAECSQLLGELDAAMSHPEFFVSVAASFLTADFSGDGRLAPEEFAPAAVDAIRRFLPGSAASATTPQQVGGLFGAFDMDGDGTLDTNEFVLFVQWVMVSTVGDDVDKICSAEEERRRIRAEEGTAKAREAHVETTEERVARLQDEVGLYKLTSVDTSLKVCVCGLQKPSAMQHRDNL